MNRRRTLAALLILGVGIATIAGGSFMGTASQGGERSVDETLQADPGYIAAVYAGCGADKACIKERIAPMVNADPVGSVEAVLAMFEGREVPHVGCHWAMHLVGQILQPRTLDGERFGLERRWLACNAAILHGAFEDLELEGDAQAVGRQAFDICNNAEFSLDIIGHCFHPIGHTVLLNLPAGETGPYLIAAESACIEGAWSTRNVGRIKGAMLACLGGAHMGYRDKIARPQGAITRKPGQTWAEAFPQCAQSLAPYGCITLYYDDFLSQKQEEATAEAIDLMEWCIELSPEADESCAHFFGLSLVASYQEAVSADLVTVCLRSPVLSERARNACLRGVLDELDSEITSREPVEREFCAVMEQLRIPCEDVTEFKMEYPSPRPLEEVLAERGSGAPGV